MLQKLNEYLIDLRKNANRWERTDINGNENTSFSAKYIKKYIFVLISIAVVYKLSNGFPQHFVDYSSKTLAIIVGLFMTAVIFSFNKFYEPISQANASAKEKLANTQAYNYSKQFAYITSYNVVLCLFVITALSLNTLFETTMNVNFRKFDFVFTNINLGSILLFCKLSLVALQRFLIVYWMLRILFSTLFAVSSMVKFMTTKLDRQND